MPLPNYEKLGEKYHQGSYTKVVASTRYGTNNDLDNLVCPDLGKYYKLVQKADSSEKIFLVSRSRQYQLSIVEGFALRYFTGKFTLCQIQLACQQEFADCHRHLVEQLLSKLINWQVLATDLPEQSSHILSPLVQWFPQENGWVVRHPERGTCLFLSPDAKSLLERLGQTPKEQVAAEIGAEKLQNLLQPLAAAGMLPNPSRWLSQARGHGQASRGGGKFNPLQLLYHRVPVGNPDPWLSRHVGKLSWLWHPRMGFCLSSFLVFSAIVALSEQQDLIAAGKLMLKQGFALVIPMGLLSMLVITLHELGHCFTLKHYACQYPESSNLKVPEVGVMFMCFMPAAYCKTTDLVCLPQKYQRTLVVAAGVLVQVMIAAIAFWVWKFSADWLHDFAYLLFSAALLTVALNLNPLAKFDGYYLLQTMTGIFNLRSRSRSFYSNLFHRRPLNETPSDQRVLAVYAPLSIAYSFLVLGFLFYRFFDWGMNTIPCLTVLLLATWLIYFYLPAHK